jgi:hypothetical protein
MAYATDNNDKLAGNMSVQRINQPGSWVLGNAKQDRTSSNIQAGVMFPYASAVGAYRCQTDKSTVSSDRALPRTHSYTMNGDNGVAQEFQYSVTSNTTNDNGRNAIGIMACHALPKMPRTNRT